MEERQREDLGDIQELAASIKEHGQLQPIVVEQRGEKYYLRAGGRRLTAFALLQLPEIDALIRGEMTELEAQLVELEENARRKDLEWQEKVKAVRRIHDLKMKVDTSWTADKTAAIIGSSRRTVFNALELSDAVETVPEVAAADKMQAAYNRLKRHKQIEQRKEDVKLRQIQVERGTKPRLSHLIHNGDCVAFMRDNIPPESVDLIITDPPWAVNFDDLVKSGEKTFDDSLAVLPTVMAAVKEMFRVLKKDRWTVMYWPTNATELPANVLEQLGAPAGTSLHMLGRWFLTSAGYKVHARPVIWYKPNKHFGSVQDPSREVNSQYETMFLATKGDARFFKRLPSDVLVGDVPGEERLHPCEKNLDVSKLLVDSMSVGGETVFDPFTGGGVHGEATLLLERNFIGCELDKEFAERSDMRCTAIDHKMELVGPAPTEAPANSATDAPSLAGVAFDQEVFDE